MASAMTSTAGLDPIACFSPQVLAFRWQGAFQLRHDLECLAQLRRTAAHEGVIFYCARILEALTGAAVDAVHLPRAEVLINNLNAIHDYHLLPRSTFYWAHA